MLLALIRGPHPGLCPLNLLTACAAEGGVDLTTVPESQFPLQADLVIVDDPDSQRSLEYIRALHEQAPATAVLMVAQDPDTKLLRQLLGLHVAAFVPAPVSRESFQQAFHQLTQDISQFRQNYVPTARLDQAQDTIKELTQERFLVALTAGSIPEGCPNDVLCATYGLDPDSRYYAAACISTGPRPIRPEDTDGNRRQDLPGWIERWTLDQGAKVVWRDTPDVYSGIFCFPGSVPPDFFLQLHEQLQAAMGEALTVTLGYSQPREQIHDLGHALEQARNCVRSRLLNQPGCAIGEDTLLQGTECGAQYWTFQRTLQFRTAMVVGSEELAIANLEQLFEDLMDHCADSTVLMSVLGMIPHLVLGGLNPSEHSRMLTYVFTLDFWNQVDCSDSLPELLERLKIWLRNKMNQYRVTPSSSPAVARCLEYIGRNISGHLSLQEAADAVGLTPAYLSTLFRQQVGWTFTEYIQALRLSTALHLLQDAELSVAEVAQAAGYKDYRHFTRVFTRTLGLNPSQYRRNQRQDS